MRDIKHKIEHYSQLRVHHTKLAGFHDGIRADSRDAFLFGRPGSAVARHVLAAHADTAVGAAAARALVAGRKTMLLHTLELPQLRLQLLLAQREPMRV